MDRKLSHIASIAEIVAAIAVVLSLIFVGMQISDANKETRAMTMQSANDAELFAAATFARHAGTWDKILTGQSLADGEEFRTAIVIFNMAMIESENRYQQFNAGYLNAQSWEGSVKSLQSMVLLPIYADWRDSPGGQQHSTDFLELVDRLAIHSPDQ